MAKKDFAAVEQARAVTGDSRARDALRSRMATPTRVKLEELQPNPKNPRYEADDPEVQELAATLTRSGQIQAARIASLEEYLRVFPDQRSRLGSEPWVVIVGNRRLAGARVAGLPSLDVRVAEDLTSAEDFEDLILVENIQRKDLPPLLEAEYLQSRLTRPGESFRTVGEAIGKSHAYVQQRIELLKLIPELQQVLRDGSLGIKAGRLIGGLSEDEQRRIAEAGPPYVARSATTPTPSAVNPVATPAEDETAVEQSQDEVGVGAGSGPAPADAVNPVATPATARPDGGAVNPVATSKHDHEPLESTRAAVISSIETALTLLDRALPEGGDGNLGRALAEGQRHLTAARKAISEASSAARE